MGDNPMLGPEHIAHCRIFTDRGVMMRALAQSNTIGAEIGVWTGDFSQFLVEQLSLSELHLIDIVIRSEVRRLASPIIRVHEGDSSTILKAFSDHYFDWLYIDGDHSYAGVL